jgi:16S rRNA (uracil1498-N3)-methyltransferase
VALEACKQCGQDWLTEIEVPCDLAAAIKFCETATLKFVASLRENAGPLRTHWNRNHDDGNPAVTGAAVAIGPEGDFTEDEYLAFHRAGFRAWSLGARTLRSETAAICALSILGYELAEDHLPI